MRASRAFGLVAAAALLSQPAWAADDDNKALKAQVEALTRELRAVSQQSQRQIKTLQGQVQDLSRRLDQKTATETAAAKAPAPVPPSVQQAAPTPPRPPRDLADATTPTRDSGSVSGNEEAAPRPGNAPIDPEYKGFTPLLGTETWIKLSGYAKIDVIGDSEAVKNPNEFVTNGIPVEGDADYHRGETATVQTKQSRINLELRRPTDFGSLRIVYENDFFGDSTTGAMTYRLRHFYGQLNNALVGQTFTTFQDPDVSPDTLDFEGPNALTSLRQAQIRYTFPLIKDQMHLAVAIEQPSSGDIQLPDNHFAQTKLPDFAANWRWDFASASHVQVGSVFRWLDQHDSAPGMNKGDSSAFGWGLNLSAGLATFGSDNILFSGTYGEGVGRYIQDLPLGTAIDHVNDLKPLPAYGIMAAYRHFWAPDWRSTVTYGYVHSDSLPEQGTGAYDYTHYASANLVWAPTSSSKVGLEYLYGFRETAIGRSGEDNRLQFSMQYTLVK
ncbi:MAG TPA: DcaP family trimeric outer membrane transporter [Alphaproteobacteria bacterium]|jgi:hypothetical protein|nr:DcaP family trimeric outer membrane transporter [Alphaproteobacteria bacterium]